MESQDKENLKLKYKILSISSNDKHHDVINLLKNTGNEIFNPWLSEQNCTYPQEIVLQTKSAKIKYLEFLCHEYCITKKIEIFVSNNNIDYSKVGFFRFNDNFSTNYCARELKYVYLPCTIKCAYIKLKFYNPYHNYLNKYSQIGLYCLNIIPEEFPSNVLSETITTSHKLTSLVNKKNINYNNNLINNNEKLKKKELNKYDSNISDNNISEMNPVYSHNWGNYRRSYSYKRDKNKINTLYEKLENKIKCFEKLKGECVVKEEFNKANELKKIVNIFIFLKNVITFLKGKKSKYVKEENYGKAKKLKEKEIKIKIIIQNIEELKVIHNSSKKWYYEWLVLYYKELELHEKEINKIMSNENIKNIKKICGIVDQDIDTNDDNDIDLNNILIFIGSDNDKQREMGYDMAYKPFEFHEKTKKKNVWYNNIESLCFIIKSGISDNSYYIFVKSVVILEKMLIMFQHYFLKMDNNTFVENSTNEKNVKYLNFIISSLLKRLDDSNLDIVDISIKTIMMMLHNKFTSFKNVFSIILSMLFYFFSNDTTSEVNEKIIVSLMSFYYSLINKYYTSVKEDINLKKVLEIILMFLEVNVEAIKQTALDFFVNMYNIVENRDELFEEFLLNVSSETKSLIIKRINENEKKKSDELENFNDEKKEEIELMFQKSNFLKDNKEFIKENTCLNKSLLKVKDSITSEKNNIDKSEQIKDLIKNTIENKEKENDTSLNKIEKDIKLVDINSKDSLEEKSNSKKNIAEDVECEHLKADDGKKEEDEKPCLNNLGSFQKREDLINDQENKNINIKNEEKSTIQIDNTVNKSESMEDYKKLDENEEPYVPPFTCKYCFRTDETFTEIGLEKHWIKNCPMLCACPNCFLIVELVVIHDHFISECSHSYMYTPCEYCNKIVKQNLLDTHVMSECKGKKTEYLSCYYCSLCIESFEIDKWRDHFLSCSKNPRLLQ